MKTGFKVFLTVWIAAVLLFGNTAVASTPSLTIISPASGTVVAPGQTISIEVARSADSGITSVALNFGDWTSAVQGEDPLTFSITIPASAQSGPFPIRAVDATLHAKQGLGIISEPLILTVRGAAVTSLGANLRTVRMRFAGTKAQLRVIGYASKGVSVPLENPSAVTFTSQVPSVAAVDPSGLITAFGPGQTTVIAVYRNPNGPVVAVNVPVFVANPRRGDFNGDGKVDEEDISILKGALNTSAVVPNDARDLNHDGKINVADEEILEGLCTYSGCATSSPKKNKSCIRDWSGPPSWCPIK